MNIFITLLYILAMIFVVIQALAYMVSTEENYGKDPFKIFVGSICIALIIPPVAKLAWDTYMAETTTEDLRNVCICSFAVWFCWEALYLMLHKAQQHYIWVRKITKKIMGNYDNPTCSMPLKDNVLVGKHTIAITFVDSKFRTFMHSDDANKLKANIEKYLDTAVNAMKSSDGMTMLVKPSFEVNVKSHRLMPHWDWCSVLIHQNTEMRYEAVEENPAYIDACSSMRTVWETFDVFRKANVSNINE